MAVTITQGSAIAGRPTPTKAQMTSSRELIKQLDYAGIFSGKSPIVKDEIMRIDMQGTYVDKTTGKTMYNIQIQINDVPKGKTTISHANVCETLQTTDPANQRGAAGKVQKALNRSLTDGHSYEVTGTVVGAAEMDIESTEDVADDLGVDTPVLPSVQGDDSTPSNWAARTLKKPAGSTAEYNEPAKKYYVVNETGNIMLSSTEPVTSSINANAQALFEEVSVFFAAMTKAITSTPRYGATKPYGLSDYYTLYDYEALEGVINRSGMFVNVHREDLYYSTEEVTATFNVEFIEAVLGVALTDGVGAGALMASLNAMGKQASFSYHRTKKYQKVGNILFVCEYLFGMPIVDVLYFYLDENETKTVVDASPCVKTSKDELELTIHKDSFMFVPPNWIRKYAHDLSSVADEADYQLLVKELQAYISDTPVVLSVHDGSDDPVQSLTVGSSYTLNGINLSPDDKPGQLLINGVAQTVATTEGSWTNETIAFTAVAIPGTGGPIVVQTAKKEVAESPITYTVSASS